MTANATHSRVGAFVRFCSDIFRMIVGMREASGFDDERLAWL